MDLTLLQGSRDYSSEPSHSSNDIESDELLESEQSTSNDSDAEFVLEKCNNDFNKSSKCSKKRLMSPGNAPRNCFLCQILPTFNNYTMT